MPETEEKKAKDHMKRRITYAKNHIIIKTAASLFLALLLIVSSAASVCADSTDFYGSTDTVNGSYWYKPTGSYTQEHLSYEIKFRSMMTINTHEDDANYYVTVTAKAGVNGIEAENKAIDSWSLELRVASDANGAVNGDITATDQTPKYYNAFYPSLSTAYNGILKSSYNNGTPYRQFAAVSYTYPKKTVAETKTIRFDPDLSTASSKLTINNIRFDYKSGPTTVRVSDSITNGPSFRAVTGQITVPALDNYSISYDLGGGVDQGSPTNYYATQTATLVEPTREGYIFTGWTGSNGTTPQKNVTITSSDRGNKSYTANWRDADNAVRAMFAVGKSSNDTPTGGATIQSLSNDYGTLGNIKNEGYQYALFSGIVPDGTANSELALQLDNGALLLPRKLTWSTRSRVFTPGIVDSYMHVGKTGGAIN